MWRRLVVIGVLCAGVVPVVNASAHNGIGAAFKGRAGHYIVYAYDGELLSNGAHPTVTATRPGGTATAKVTPFGNVFFYRLPNPYPHDWDLHLRISGRLGNGAVEFQMHGVTPIDEPSNVVVKESGSRSWPLFVGIASVLVLAGFTIFRFLGHPSVPGDHLQED